AASRCLWNESLPPEVDIRDGATSPPEHVTPLSRSAPGGFLCAPARNQQAARKSADCIIRLRGHSPPFPAGRLFSSGPREGSKTHEFACDRYGRVTPHGWHSYPYGTQPLGSPTGRLFLCHWLELRPSRL